MAFPTTLPGLTTTHATGDTIAAANQNTPNTEVNAIGAKVGIDASAVTTSHDYKLSGVTGTDKAASKTGTETLTNKTLTAPVIATIVNTGTLTLPTSTDTLVAKATTDTLTNKTVTKRVTALTDAVTVDWNSDNMDIGTVTLAGNRTLGAPTGTAVNGQMFELRVRQDATGSRTLAYNAIFRFGTDVTSPTLTTTAAKTDYLLFQYHSGDTKWDCLAVAKGY